MSVEKTCCPYHRNKGHMSEGMAAQPCSQMPGFDPNPPKATWEDRMMDLKADRHFARLFR